jgi:5'-3' exoribonuclease 1
MGVKHFYLWYSRNFSRCLSSHPQEPIDVLALDLNGLFHPVAQKVFQYGSHAPPVQYLSRPKPTRPRSMLHLFKEICEKIEYCRKVCKPRKKLVLCVDGVAGLGKMNQQRQRRFRTAKALEDSSQTFNPNAFTPGTKLMDHLTKYIDWYLRSMISYHPEWKDLEIIFSNEKVPGEGEHKIMQYIREHGSPTDSYCIYGLDADLIMLGMVLPVDKVMIAREADEGVVQFVDVRSFKSEILTILRWPSGSTAHPTATFSERDGIHDFIVLCFLVGNDFLPTVPSLAIIDGGIDIMMSRYRELGQKNGHLTRVVPGKKRLALKNSALIEFFSVLGSVEKEMLEKKYTGRPNFFPDPLVLKHRTDDGKLDMEAFKKDYYEKNLTGYDVQEVVKNYLDGMCWVLNYYRYGIPDWLWYFPYLYGPFLSDFSTVLASYKSPKFELNQPVPPFLQLMVVLPSSSADLVPDGLNELMSKTDSPLVSYYPRDFEVDMAGKKRDWEGIVLLPHITIGDFMEYYRTHVRNVTPSILKRNIRGKNFIYVHQPNSEVFVSFYGNIDNCTVRTTPIVF